MKLTPKTYYTSKNEYLSNSGCSLFLKDKSLFYKKYILKERVKESSTALTIGKAFDLLITGSQKEFNNCYELKVLKKEDAEKFKEQKTTKKRLLTNTEYNDIIGMYNSLKVYDNGKLLEELKGMDSQTILQYDMKISQFKGICGIPDAYKIEGTTCYLYDLKTTRPFLAPKDWSITEKEDINRQYYYKCRDYGYFRQLAMYRMLLKIKHPELETFIMKHIVCEKANGLDYPVHVFNFEPSLIDVALGELKEIINQIRIEEEYKGNPQRQKRNPEEKSVFYLTKRK